MRLLSFINLVLILLFSHITAQATYATTPSSTPRVALVLGGGGARGMAHVGVLKVLQQENIPIDLIVGTSAGNIVGALYAGNPNADDVERILLQAGLSDMLDLSPSLLGAVSGNKLQQFVIHHVKATDFNQLKIPFVSVATDVQTGQTVAIHSGPLAPAVNASGALPSVFHPVKLRGRVLVDGGVTDLVPVDVALTYHPEIVIAVDIAPDLPKTMPTSRIETYNRAYTLYDEHFAIANMRGADVIIHPAVGQTGVFDSSNKRGLLRAGETATRQALPQICGLLKAKKITSKCSP